MHYQTELKTYVGGFQPRDDSLVMAKINSY